MKPLLLSSLPNCMVSCVFKRDVVFGLGNHNPCPKSEQSFSVSHTKSHMKRGKQRTEIYSVKGQRSSKPIKYIFGIQK